MQVETLRDVVAWTSQFHGRLANCMQSCAQINDNPRAQLLLDYLAKHEQSLAHTVSEFEDIAESRAVDTWCDDYLEKNPILQSFHCDAPFQDLNDEEIMSVLSDQHEQVIDLYRYLHAKADSDSTRELMEEVEALEEQEVRQMTQAANRMQDM